MTIYTFRWCGSVESTTDYCTPGRTTQNHAFFIPWTLPRESLLSGFFCSWTLQSVTSSRTLSIICHRTLFVWVQFINIRQLSNVCYIYEKHCYLISSAVGHHKVSYDGRPNVEIGRNNDVRSGSFERANRLHNSSFNYTKIIWRPKNSKVWVSTGVCTLFLKSSSMWTTCHPPNAAHHSSTIRRNQTDTHGWFERARHRLQITSQHYFTDLIPMTPSCDRYSLNCG